MDKPTAINIEALNLISVLQYLAEQYEYLAINGFKNEYMITATFIDWFKSTYPLVNGLYYDVPTDPNSSYPVWVQEIFEKILDEFGPGVNPNNTIRFIIVSN